MRRKSPAFVIGATLLIAACSAGDRATSPTGPSEQPSGPDLATSTTTGTVCGNYPSTQAAAIQQILTELGYVYPRFSPPLVALQLISNLLGTALARAQQTSAQQFAVQIITRLQSDLKAGKLQKPPANNIGNPPFTTAADVVDNLVKRLQCLTALPVTGNDPNSGVGIVTPNAASTIVTGNLRTGVSFPSGTVNTTTVITVQRLANGPALLTSLDQFPAFFEISSSNGAQITQQNQVIVGICNVANNDGYATNGNLLIAHNVGPNFGDVEVLPPVSAGFLDCSQPISSATGARRNFAAASWHAVSNGLGSFAKTLFLPMELHAAALAGGGPGGYTGKFSPFGTVDINSNPAKLIIVDGQGNAISGLVTGTGTVQVNVKAISAGAHYAIEGGYLGGAYPSPNPIPGVPVHFGATIVTTGPNGMASFPWPAAAGASLTATVDVDGGCPTAPGTPSHPPVTVANAFRPPVCFTPSSVTFTTSIPSDYGSQNYKYLFVGTSVAPTAPTATPPASWFTPGFDASAWPTAAAPFGDVDQYAGTCSIFGSAPTVATQWFPSTRSVDQYQSGTAATSLMSGLLARKMFSLPTGFSGTVTINVAIDNDIALYLNGTALTPSTAGVSFTPDQTATGASDGTAAGWADPAYSSGAGFWLHGGCASRGSGMFAINTATAPTGLLNLGGANLLAIYGRDRGGATYFDAQITLQAGQ